MNIKRIMHGRIRINGETQTELGETSLGVLLQTAIKSIIESPLKAEEARTISIDFSTRRFNDDSAPKEISVDDLFELQKTIGEPEIEKVTLDDCPMTQMELMNAMNNEYFFHAFQAVKNNQTPSTAMLTHQMIQYLDWLKQRLREARQRELRSFDAI